MDRGSIIMDRVFWIDYFGSIIMDRVFWIDYYGSCILDRLFWIDYFGSMTDRGAAWSRDRRAYCAWALKIDSAIAVQRCELNTRAYAHATYTFRVNALRNYAITALRVQQSWVYRCRENTLIACIFVDFSPSTAQHHTQRDHALCL